MHSDVDPSSIAAAAGADTEVALRAMVAASADGLALLDDEGCFAAVNDAAARILGRPAPELVGCSGPFAVTADPAYARGTRLATSWSVPDGRRRELEYRFAAAAGGATPCGSATPRIRAGSRSG